MIILLSKIDSTDIVNLLYNFGLGIGSDPSVQIRSSSDDSALVLVLIVLISYRFNVI